MMMNNSSQGLHSSAHISTKYITTLEQNKSPNKYPSNSHVCVRNNSSESDYSNAYSTLHNSNRLHSLVRSLQSTVASRPPNSLVTSASTPCVLNPQSINPSHHSTSAVSYSKNRLNNTEKYPLPVCLPDNNFSNQSNKRNISNKNHLKNDSTSESFKFLGSLKRKSKNKRQSFVRSQSSECSNTTESTSVWRTCDSLVPLCTANTASLIFAFYSDEQSWQKHRGGSHIQSSINSANQSQSLTRLARPLDLLSKMTASANDSKYKSYVASVDKALKNFEYTSEWADLVNALAKLNRVLRSNARYNVVPRRFIVGQRLAQCMHPLLPSGVHLGALETYDLIFKCLGPQKLLSELTIYSNGLFPLLANAAINVRPSLLELYEKHLLPLGPALRPALDGFLIGVLPCYEEGSEIFNRTDNLLNQVALNIGGQAYFFDALWRCILYNSSVRLPAITFVVGQFNKKRSLSDQSHILGLCIQTLVKAICASLLDSKILVQRAILDLLLLMFPLHLNLSNEMEQAMSAPSNNVEENSGRIQPPNSLALPSLGSTDSGSSLSTVTRLTVPRKHLKRSELVAIITAALTVLLRRDVSLNRRLQSWFFGADSTTGPSKSSTPTTATATTVATTTTTSSAECRASPFQNKSINSDPKKIDKSSSQCDSQTTKPTRKSKRIVYFENYAKSFVIEAFKRCITDPVGAITSVLPASAITNSFISFTLQTDSNDANADNLHSGLMTATSSANHNQRTRQVINSSFSISSSSNPECYAMTNSTFWPYRLLICILDQRDLATPILESLYVDILRGLYHEFELLTNVVPPPSEESTDLPDSPKCFDPDCSLTSFSEEDVDECLLKSLNENDENMDKQSFSISDCDDASDTLSDIERKNFRKPSRPRSSGTANRSRRLAYMRSNSGSSRKARKLPGVRKLSSSSNSSKRTAIFASAPAVADVQTESGESSLSIKIDPQIEFRSPRAVPGFAVLTKIPQQQLSPDSQVHEKHDSESSEIESDSKKIKENLFTNLRRNVKTKSVTMMRKLRPSSSNNKPTTTSTQSGQSKMKSVMQTLPLVKQLKIKLSKYEERSVAKKKAKKLNQMTNASIHQNAIYSGMKEDSSNLASSQVPSVTIIEDEKYFTLRHQHYYWNPYYQQLSKSQRKELLKELDRVMHLLITGIGNDFIWSKLAAIFDTATNEAISLRKLLRMIIKDVEQYEKMMYRHDSAGDLSQDEEDDDDGVVDDDDDDGGVDDDDDDDGDDDDDDYDDDDDTDAYSDSTDENSDNHEESLDFSLTWARKLASTLLNEFMHENQHRNQDKKDDNTFYVGEDSLRFDMITGKVHNGKFRPKIFSSTSTTWLKHKILNGLSDRCRECHQPLPYKSPVQPVGTDSTTILESCTLVRFLLGDSRPYHQQENNIFLGEDDSLLSADRSGMLTNSISSSMNRSSALEPLAVYTSNYHFMILFLERVLQLMTNNAKSFSPIDLGASVELCLALCAKLKPAIMQTFVQRYRLALTEHLMNVRAKVNGNNESTSGELHQTHHRRKSSSGSWFSQIFPPMSGSSKATRTSSTASSKKHLELVKEEEDEEFSLNSKTKITKNTEINVEIDTESNQEMTAINEDLQLQSVVDGVLNFFTIFVESILLKIDNRLPTMEQFDQDADTENSSRLSIGANRLLEFFRDNICNSRNRDDFTVRERLTFRHQLLPVYEKLCELLIEIGTAPVLTSPAIFIKKRQSQSKKLFSNFQNNIVTENNFDNFNNNVFENIDQTSKWIIAGKHSNARWFMYLLILSSDRLSSCALRHSKNSDHNVGVCCHLRQIALTSLTTILDLMTISRAYLFRMLPDSENREVSLNFQLEQLFSNNDNSEWDMFPGTFDARRLNFFPLIPVDILQHLYNDTTWFSLVAARLWSNLSPSDSAIHYSVIALLQQLHSVAPDSSVCESVFCDEMTGGELSRKYLEYDDESTESYDEENDEDGTFNSYSAFVSYDPNRASLQNDWSNRFGRLLNNDKIYTARTKFQLLFENIRDIRFVSERLALIVTGLASAAKIDSELEQDEHVDQFDPASTITPSNTNLTGQTGSMASSNGIVQNSGTHQSSSNNTSTLLEALKQAIRILFDTPGDLVSSQLIASIDPNNTVELDRLLRLTTPISPIALCTTLKRHFDRPLFIMLDALARRRNVAEHQAAAADWLLRCLSPFDPFGARNLPLPTSPLLISYYLASGDINSASDGSSDKSGNDYLFGGFGANTDIGRLLEPLFFILLHPNTNRLSVQNVSIERFAQRKAIEKRNDSITSFELREDEKMHSSPLKTNNDLGGDDHNDDDSKIYQISSTSGNIIYHVRKSSPPRADSNHSSPAVSIRDGSSSGLSNRYSPNVSSHVRFDNSLGIGKHNKTVNFASNFILDSVKSDNQIIDEIVEDLVDKVSKSIFESEMINMKTTLTSSVPGMARSGRLSADKSEDGPESMTSVFEFNEYPNSGKQIHISHLHMHLLLYERQFDSARTIYAFDTLLNMIETWPERMLYSMATTTFGDINQLVGASNGHLDGTRVAQIQDLYIRHRNSIQGKGFRPGQSFNAGSTSGDRLETRSNSIRTSSIKGLHKKKTKESVKPETENILNVPKSILYNVSLLEMNVQISLWYLRSYYSSCSSDRNLAESNNEKKSAKASQRLRELFANLETKNDPSFDDNSIILNNETANLIDLESVLGNQRVRLMACQLLQIIFENLSTMMDAFQSGANLSAATSKGETRFFWRKHDSIPSWALNIKAFANYLHDMLLRCEVQRHVLQCLVTSVWHFKSRKCSSNHCRSEFSQENKNSNSFLYPNSNGFIPKSTDPSAEIFVSEILNFNDYSGHNDRTDLCDQECGFHSEFEKRLLRLLEQVMILEHRVSTTTGTIQSSEQDRSSSSVGKLQRFSIELNHLRFDPNVSLAAQPLLHGAIQAALQHDSRRHLAWLALVESSLSYAGKSLSRLVLCVLSQLCSNLDSVVKQINLSLEPNSKSSQSFTTKHVMITLQSISMLISHCLLDRSQLEPLLSCLVDVFDEHDTDQLRNYGLGSSLVQIRRRRNRQKDDQFNQDSVGNTGPNASGIQNSSSGTMQIFSSMLQNFVTGSSSGNSSTNPSSSTATNSNSGSMDDTQTNSAIAGMNSDSPALIEARRSILGILNRVIVALFNVWCNLVVVGEDEDELRTNADQWEPNSLNRVIIDDSIRKLSMCCHYYTKTQSCSSGAYSSAESIRKREHYRQSSCASGWSSASQTGWYIMGSAAQIRKNITVLLSILALSHGPSLMSSIAQVWAELRDAPSETDCPNKDDNRSRFNYLYAPVDLVIAPVSITQRRLIRLIGSLTPIFPLEALVQTIKTSLKNSSSGVDNRKIDKENFYIMEISILEFLLAYIRSISGPVLLNTWRPIFTLVRDAMMLNVQVTLPTEMLATLSGNSVAQQWGSSNTAAVSISIQPLINYHLLAILHEFLFIAPLTEDRKVLKEMQDIATRLIENIIASSTVRLTHSRWPFRRNLEVSVLNDETDRKNIKKNDSSPNNSISDTSMAQDSHDISSTFANLFFSGSNFFLPGATPSTGSVIGDCAQAMFDSFFCVKALYALSEFAALVLDVVYPSDEKEKMNPLISNLMNYVVPYLRAHVSHNWACFDACTRLLATLTDYQHTRKAWRKDTLDLLVDNAFFQMPAECLAGWRTIVDRVMTHDKNTFREFLARIALQNPSTTLNKIFTSAATVRDQEAESKAQLVKRLSFILFCSEKDQYQKYMSEIQEKLIEIHRTSQSPLVHAQVLLAFRVIILRMSPQHLASLWPFIYTEMFQVFLNIEQQLLDFIYTHDQRFINGNTTPDYISMMGSNIQSTNVTPVPTPTSWEAREFSSIDDKSSCDSLRSPTTPLKFKPIQVQPTSGKSSKLSPTPIVNSKQTKEEKFGPKIAPQQLQLLLNACKLLDLALILPSDTLPIFQLHRWTFVGDGTGYQYPNHMFDIGTLFSASANSASNGIDFSATSTSSIRHQILDNDSNDFSSLHTSHSTGNFSTSNDGQDSIGTMDSLSMNSALSSLNDSGPSSSGTLSVSSKVTLTPASNHQPFIPHIVFLSSILNYLSHTPVKFISFSNSSPILVNNQIDSVHDLHSFFYALLARSNRAPTVYTPSDAPETESINSGIKHFPYRNEAQHKADGRSHVKLGKINKSSTSARSAYAKSSIRSNESSLGVENVSLEELFLNIDRIIANDFLETLSTTEN